MNRKIHQGTLWDENRDQNRDDNGADPGFYSAYRPSFDFFDHVQQLKDALGGTERVSAWLGEKYKQLQKRISATDPDRLLDVDQHLFRMMDRAAEFGIDEPVLALVDYINRRYGRAPSVSLEEMERLHKAARVMDSMEDYFGDGFRKAQKEARAKTVPCKPVKKAAK